MTEAVSKPPVIVKIKRKSSHRGHHGGAWKVAYADFVTAMMALFIVLWLLTQADLQLRQSIARYFRNASVLSGGSMVGENVASVRTQESRPLEAAVAVVQGSGADLEALRGHATVIKDMLQKSPNLAHIKENVQVSVTAEGLEIQVVDSGDPGRKDLLFDVASAELKPELVTLLQKLAEYLGTLPNRIRIGGHTDARPFAITSGVSNWDLAFARANNARKVMEGNGLRPMQVLSVEAFASRQLLKPEDPLADENRRLSVLALAAPPSPAEADGTEAAEPPAPTATDGDHRPPDAATPVFSPHFVTPGIPPH